MNKTTPLIKGALIFGFILGLQLYSRAETYTVTTSTDGTSGHTLREAIMRANKHGGNNTIILRHAEYQISLPGSDGDLVITQGNLTIIGKFQPYSTITAANGARVFHVLSGTHVTFENLEITGSGNSEFFYNGGAIDNEGTLTLKNCLISGNASDSGGGIFNSGNLTLNNSTICNNSCFAESGGSGGAIYNAASLTANNCVISNNFSGAGQDGNFLWEGGVIDISGPQPSVRGGDGGKGGGIYNGGTMILNNCFILNNSTGNGGNASAGLGGGSDGGAGGHGGGIYNAGNLMLKHCIISGNSCGNGGAGAEGVGFVVGHPGENGGNGGAGGAGGGIFNANGFSVESFNSLAALNVFGVGGTAGAGYPGNSNINITPGTDGNPGAIGFGPDLFGNFVSTGYNLVRESDDSTGFTNGVSHDITGSTAAPANLQLYKSK